MYSHIDRIQADEHLLIMRTHAAVSSTEELNKLNKELINRRGNIIIVEHGLDKEAFDKLKSLQNRNTD